jgi:hypothetical protein
MAEDEAGLLEAMLLDMRQLDAHEEFPLCRYLASISGKSEQEFQGYPETPSVGLVRAMIRFALAKLSEEVA